MTSHAAATSQNAAMNLYQKFSDLQASIDLARAERAKIEKEMEELSDEQDRLQEQRRAEKVAAREAYALTRSHHEQITTLQEKFDNEIQAEHTKAVLKTEANARQLDHRKEHKVSEYQAFLQRSNEFRATCRRLRLSARMMRIPEVCMEGAVASSPGFRDSMSSPTSVTYDLSSPSSEDPDDPTSWQIPSSDDEMLELLGNYKKHKKRYDSALEIMQTKQKTKYELADKGATRVDKIAMVRKQLERVTAENNDLESQIKDLQQLTEESKFMAQNLSQGIEKRRSSAAASRPVQPCARAPNPYLVAPSATAQAQSATVSTRPVTHPVSTQDTGYYDPEPRRVRRDKQFGSSIQIVGAHEPASANENHNGSNPFDQEQLCNNDMESSDEEDDGLLSYAVF